MRRRRSASPNISPRRPLTSIADGPVPSRYQSRAGPPPPSGLSFNRLFSKRGQDGLLDGLRDTRPVGRIYTAGSIGYDLRYAEQRKLPDGGREIILATDRPMSFREIVNQPRSAQYPFTWVQFTMKPEGAGEGKLAVAARITGEEADELIEVEDFAISPVRLQHIRARQGDR